MPRQWSIEQIEAYKDNQARTQGFAETAAVFDALPAAAKAEMESVLGAIGRDVLAAQLARVARGPTGELADALEIDLLAQRLRVRVGLVGPKSKAKFYGRIVERGRKAQTVVVQRRRVGVGKLLRRGRKRAEDIAATYALRVTSLPARPFVELPEAVVDDIAAQRLADFWGRTLAAAGA